MTNKKVVEYIFKNISKENMNDLDNFLFETTKRNYTDFSEFEILEILPSLTEEEKHYLIRYIGYDYSNINASLRNTWNYENNGHIDNKAEYDKIGKEIVKIIEKHPININNKKVYRGTDIGYFKDYDIKSLSELEKLKGTYMIDKGLVSTSIKEDECFFKKDFKTGNTNNIKIIYNLPEEFNDAIFLGTQDLKIQKDDEDELLINIFNLGYISDVIINNDDTATINVVMIPKKIYDDYYKKEENNKTI